MASNTSGRLEPSAISTTISESIDRRLCDLSTRLHRGGVWPVRVWHFSPERAVTLDRRRVNLAFSRSGLGGVGNDAVDGIHQMLAMKRFLQQGRSTNLQD